MSDYVNACFSGRLGADAEVRHTPNGKAITTFTVICNVGFGDYATTEYFRCQAWGDRYTKMAPYLLKGTGVVVGAQPRTESWEKDGEKKTMTKWNVREMSFAPGGRGRQQGGAPPADAQQSLPTRQPQYDTTDPPGFDIDDIPY